MIGNMKLYDWQAKVITNYSGSGTVKAVTASGKSLIGLELAKKIGGNILVASHRTSILDQWKVIMADIENVEFETFNKLCKEKQSPVSLLIVDECHRSVSPEFIKIYDNIKYDNIIGLSATPDDESIKKCGKLLCNIGYDEANISPFKVIFHGINLSMNERAEYYKLTNSISRIMRRDEKTKEIKKLLDTIVMKRRNVVYNAERRIPYATKLIFKNYDEGHKILIICQRIKQANKISEVLGVMPHIVYHSERMDDLAEYKSGKVRVCISVGMLTHGFDDTDTDCGIIVSTTLSESFNVQSIGRVIRSKPNKFATIHILLANQTSDMKVLNSPIKENYDFELENIFVPDNIRLVKAWSNGEKYSFNLKEIWKKERNKRIYMQYNDVIKDLWMLKPGGGRFVIYKGKVYVKVKERVERVSTPFLRLIPKPEKVETVNSDDMWNEIMENWK